MAIEREKMASLKQKGGFLEVYDEGVAHIVRLPTLHSEQWLYRVFVPEDMELDVNMATYDIQKKNYPKPQLGRPSLSSGEYILSFEMHENTTGQAEMKWVIRSPKEMKRKFSTNGTLVLNKKWHDWAAKRWTRVEVITSDMRLDEARFKNWRGYQTLQLPESEPFTLVRLMPRTQMEEKKEEWNFGILIWILPRKVALANKP